MITSFFFGKHTKNGQMRSRVKSTALLKNVLYGAVLVLTISLIYLLRNIYPCLQVNRMGIADSAEVYKYNEEIYNLRELQELGLPKDFAQLDFIPDNHLVDTLVPLLKTNTRVLKEVQRIQFKMLTSLIGKFKYAMLFNFAASENKGDPAITVGELAIIRKLGIELIFHCATSCTKGIVEYARNQSEQYSTDELVILMHGGGNLLAYISEDFNRKLVLENFPDFEVILFPQMSGITQPKRKHDFFKMYIQIINA